MYALHPPLSGLPLAFILLLVGIEALRLTRLRGLLAGFRAVLVSVICVAVLAAFFSGYQAVGRVGDASQVTQDAISLHHIIGRLLLLNSLLLAGSLWLSVIASQRRWIFSSAYYAILMVQLSLVLYAGYLGGELVFRHGLGMPVVNITQVDSTAPDD